MKCKHSQSSIESLSAAEPAFTCLEPGAGAQQVFAILRGIKLIENRKWAIPKGWYALHAGRSSTARRGRCGWLLIVVVPG